MHTFRLLVSQLEVAVDAGEFDDVFDFAPLVELTGEQLRCTARNEPCPCGSGKKFKHCHGR